MGSNIQVLFKDIYGATITPSISYIGGGVPNYEERYIQHMFNIVRMNCEEYILKGYGEIKKDVICDSTLYPHTHNPLWYFPELSEAARYHSWDMAENCGGSINHYSCDGITTVYERVNGFINPVGCQIASSGENIAGGATYGFVTDLWLCEKGYDNCEYGGHTRAILTSGRKHAGIGRYTGTHGQMSTSDFSDCNLFTDSELPIKSGIYFETENQNEYKFCVNFYDPSLPQTTVTAYVIIDGDPIEIDLEFGSAVQGHYASTLQLTNANCKEYYFKFKVGNSEFFYPTVGSLTIGGNGDCPYDYIDSQLYNGPNDDDSNDDSNDIGNTNPIEIMSYVLGSLIPVFGIIFICIVLLIIIFVSVYPKYIKIFGKRVKYKQSGNI